MIELGTKGLDGVLLSSPNAVKSKFGWLLTGQALQCHYPTTQLLTWSSMAMELMYSRFWDLKSIGITKTNERNERKFLEESGVNGKKSRWIKSSWWPVIWDLTAVVYTIVGQQVQDGSQELLSEYNHIIQAQLQSNSCGWTTDDK